MKTSLDHLPHRKQRELARIVEVLHEEFEDALKEGTAEFKPPQYSGHVCQGRHDTNRTGSVARASEI